MPPESTSCAPCHRNFLRQSYSLVLAFVCSLCASSYALGQCPCGTGCASGPVDYETSTHAALTHAALSNQFSETHNFLKQELGIVEGLLTIKFMYGDNTPRTLLEWAKEGSIREDDFIFFPYGRFFHHFHDPITDQGLSGQPFPAHDAIEWAIDHPDNLWDLTSTSNYFWSWLTSYSPADRNHSAAMTFRGLGHFMHMVEDMAQPAHTRDDAHPPTDINASLEAYAGYHYGDAESLDGLEKVSVILGAQEPPFFTLNELLPGHRRYRHFFDTEQYTGQPGFAGFLNGPPGLAELSNFAFVSEDTVFLEYGRPALGDTDIDQVLSLPIGNFELKYPSDNTIIFFAPDLFVKFKGASIPGVGSDHFVCSAKRVQNTVVDDYWIAVFGGTPLPRFFVAAAGNVVHVKLLPGVVAEGHCVLHGLRKFLLPGAPRSELGRQSANWRAGIDDYQSQ